MVVDGSCSARRLEVRFLHRRTGHTRLYLDSTNFGQGSGGILQLFTMDMALTSTALVLVAEGLSFAWILCTTQARFTIGAPAKGMRDQN
jgi:hypothetical protein